jgi:myo-inositol-1(or 4)-monophosphatase
VNPADALIIAREVAAEAAELLRGAEVREVRTKATYKDLVTEWDTRVEALIARRLRERTPAFALLAEEGGADGEGDYVWVVDPIDGTVNFAHGLPMFAICISLEHRGEAVAGVVRAPALGWEFYASAGNGAYKDGAPLRVSRTAALEQAVLATGFPYDRATARFANFEEWEHFQRRAGACRRFGCASLDLAMVAAGWFDGYWERALKRWDLSAGALLVREAGGRVSSLEGERFDAGSGEALASNGAIHAQMLAELAAVDLAKRET